MEEKVSIIIPVYKAEKTIERCVQSIAEGAKMRGIVKYDSTGGIAATRAGSRGAARARPSGWAAPSGR